MNFKKDLGNMLRARFPYIYISSWEEDRVLDTISLVAQDENLIKTKRNVLSWTLTNGIIKDGSQVLKDTKNPMKALEFIEKYEEASIFVLKDFHVFLGDGNRPCDLEIVRKLRDLVYSLKQSIKPKNIIFISPRLVLPNDLQKDVTVMEFELPSAKELEKLLIDMIEVNKTSGRLTVDLLPEEREMLARASLGLTYQEAENAFARAMVTNSSIDKRDIELVLEEKRQIIRKSEILEFIKHDLDMDDVGGLENLKRWIIKRNNSWMQSASTYCLPNPKGVLITGVPGCGKSLIAKAISAIWKLPLLRLDMGKIYSGLVGSSEENMRKAIKTAEAVSPSILWIDEIEKGFGDNNNGDSGTSTRILGTFLTWMQEKNKPVFVVATANNIHKLPSELLRKGRFDEIFFVDLPTKRERIEIFKLHLNKRLKDEKVKSSIHVDDELLNNLAQLTEGFVGAEIEHIVVSGLFEAFYESRGLTCDDLEKAIHSTVPLSVTQAEQIIGIRTWASTRAVAATPRSDRKEYNNFTEESSDIIASRGGRAIDF
ncbi:AAA family ATPase [Romboutsia ilealis]|uniref:Uncharacterized AAA domain-containing protein ycf46 n=1 Tax=Romboutsia faecis TaxID=2764597 RepID=A0ABR7JQE7_9FIRM|nr:AAA family ATPase [Romboutsia faecis]MBC5997141.1 AAA family ATPase [Romboutsia faecis]MRN23422.1 AAA family ATPase [Romboutsia ilealis]